MPSLQVPVTRSAARRAGEPSLQDLRPNPVRCGRVLCRARLDPQGGRCVIDVQAAGLTARHVRVGRVVWIYVVAQ